MRFADAASRHAEAVSLSPQATLWREGSVSRPNRRVVRSNPLLLRLSGPRRRPTGSAVGGNRQTNILTRQVTLGENPTRTSICELYTSSRKKTRPPADHSHSVRQADRDGLSYRAGRPCPDSFMSKEIRTGLSVGVGILVQPCQHQLHSFGHLL